VCTKNESHIHDYKAVKSSERFDYYDFDTFNSRKTVGNIFAPDFNSCLIFSKQGSMISTYTYNKNAKRQARCYLAHCCDASDSDRNSSVLTCRDDLRNYKR